MERRPSTDSAGQKRDIVLGDLWVARDQGQGLSAGLSDEHPVGRVAMVQRQRAIRIEV